jgi:hypothetical protein
MGANVSKTFPEIGENSSETVSEIGENSPKLSPKWKKTNQ